MRHFVQDRGVLVSKLVQGARGGPGQGEAFVKARSTRVAAALCCLAMAAAHAITANARRAALRAKGAKRAPGGRRAEHRSVQRVAQGS